MVRLTSLSNALPKTQADLIQLFEPVRADLEAVEREYERQVQSQVHVIPEIGAYIQTSGGKRVRPAVLLMAARLCGYTGPHAVLNAAVVEFIHTATLLHDDVVDASDLRRGRNTANAAFGNAAAVLVGDFLYSRAFQMMVEVDDMRVMRVLAEATNTIAAGEVMQLMGSHDPEVNEARYLEVIRRKTAKLFEAAARLGGVLARNQLYEEQLAEYGRHVGTAFQLVDDVLDYGGELGKSLGDDLAEGKPTLPLIYTMRCGSPAQAAVVRQAIAQGGRDEFAGVLEAIRACGALDYARAAAAREAEVAQRAIGALPESEYRRSLLELASFAVTRSSTQIGA
jgi:octaprenyl-diphosphate synthase